MIVLYPNAVSWTQHTAYCMCKEPIRLAIGTPILLVKVHFTRMIVKERP